MDVNPIVLAFSREHPDWLYRYVRATSCDCELFDKPVFVLVATSKRDGSMVAVCGTAEMEVWVEFCRQVRRLDMRRG